MDICLRTHIFVTNQLLLVKIYHLKTIFFLFAVSFFSSLFAQNKVGLATKTVRISGTIQNPQGQKLKLTVPQNFIEPGAIFETYADGYAKFYFTISVAQATSATLTFIGEDIELFLEPDDELTMNFDGNDPLGTVQFQGKGSAHNTFLRNYNNAFKSLTDNALRFDMTQKEPTSFQNYLGNIYLRKWAYWDSYDLSEKQKFSNHFLHYVYANIDFWWANNLFKYRIEHATAKGSAVPISLPDAYFDFLKPLHFNQTAALNNPQYVNFLDNLLAWFKQENLQANRLGFNYWNLAPNRDSIFLYDEPNENKIVAGKIYKNMAVTYLDKYPEKITPDTTLEKPEMQFFKIRTADNQVAWVAANDVLAEATPLNKSPQKREKLIHEVNRVSVKIICWMDGLQLRKNPADQEGIITLKKNEVLNYLNQKTENRYFYTVGNTNYYDIFYKVSTQKGIEGWLFAGGINLFEQMDTIRTETEQIEPNNISIFSDFDRILYGKILLFCVLKDIYNRSYTESPAALYPAVEQFLARNENIEWDKSIRGFYESAVKNWSKTERLPQEKYPALSKTISVKNTEKAEFLQKMRTVPMFVSQKSSPTLKVESVKLESKVYPELLQKIVTNNKKSTKIAIEILSDSRSEFQLMIYKDPTLLDETICKLLSNAEEKIIAEFDIQYPTLGELRYGDKKVDLYIEPGDDFVLQFDGDDFLKSVHCTGAGSIHNNYLFDFQRKFAVTELEMKKRIKDDKAENYKSFMNSYLSTKQKFLQGYPSAKQFSNYFKYYSAAELVYWYGFYLLNYPLEYPLYHDLESPMAMAENYYDFLTGINISAENVMPSRYYSFFLQQYLDYQNQRVTNKKSVTELANSYLSGEAKIFTLARQITSDFKREGSQATCPKMVKFMQSSANEKYNNWMLELYQNSEKKLELEAAPNFFVREKNGKSWSIKDVADRVVCLDFWATWCEPCLISMKTNRKVANKLKMYPVTFINISVDEKKDTWLRWLNAHPSEDLQVYPDSPTQISEAYRVRQLPHCVLLDKKGNIVKVFDGTPDEQNLEKAIMDLLK